MSLNANDILESQRRLTHTENLCANVLANAAAATAARAPQGYLSAGVTSVSRFFTSAAPAPPPPSTSLPSEEAVRNAEVRATVVRGEAALLMAVCQLLQDSYTAFAKAGWYLRKGNNCLAAAIQKVQQQAGVSGSFDRNTLGGVQLGSDTPKKSLIDRFHRNGAMNLVISVLPAKLLKIVAFFGFPSDRRAGLQSLHLCFQGQSLRSSLAAVILLGYFVVYPSQTSFLIPFFAPFSLKMLQEAQTRYSKSALMVYMSGRAAQGARDPQRARQCYNRCLSDLSQSSAASSEWIGLIHLCLFELGFASFFEGDWKEFAVPFARLETESKWSKAFCMYCLALSWEARGYGQSSASVTASGIWHKAQPDAEAQEDAANKRAVQLYNDLPSRVVRTFGGKTLTVEKFVLRRAKMASQRLTSSTNLQHLVPVLVTELFYHFNGLIQAQMGTLESCLQGIQTSLRTSSSSNGPFGPGDFVDARNGKFALLVDPITDVDLDSLALMHLFQGSLLRELGHYSEGRKSLLHLVVRLLPHAALNDMAAADSGSEMPGDAVRLVGTTLPLPKLADGQPNPVFTALPPLAKRRALRLQRTTPDGYVLPYACYELGLIDLVSLTGNPSARVWSATNSRSEPMDERTQTARCTYWMKKARDAFSDYEFEFRLHGRVDAALQLLEKGPAAMIGADMSLWERQ